MFLTLYRYGHLHMALIPDVQYLYWLITSGGEASLMCGARSLISRSMYSSLRLTNLVLLLIWCSFNSPFVSMLKYSCRAASVLPESCMSFCLKASSLIEYWNASTCSISCSICRSVIYLSCMLCAGLAWLLNCFYDCTHVPGVVRYNR